MNQVGHQFGVKHFYQDALADRQKVYQEAVQTDQHKGDANQTADQVQFNFEGKTTQVIINEEADMAMARSLDADGNTVGIEKLGEKIEVATRTLDGFAAQTAEEIPGSGDGWYTPRVIGVTNSDNPEASFSKLNEQFEAEWKMA